MVNLKLKIYNPVCYFETAYLKNLSKWPFHLLHLPLCVLFNENLCTALPEVQIVMEHFPLALDLRNAPRQRLQPALFAITKG